jgi:protein-S-isoprenylcysteine O-methyltransferase Ste14
VRVPVFHIVVTAALALQFVHYYGAGARTFVRSRLDDGGEEAAALFAVAGAGVFILAWIYRIALLNGVIALGLTGASLCLYKWARLTIRGRRFAVIFGDNVPDAVCDSGPYAYIRHPFYASYVIGFTAALVAFPNVFVALGWLIATWFFVHGARHDEKAIRNSPLASAYADYRRRTGMFFPTARK